MRGSLSLRYLYGLNRLLCNEEITCLFYDTHMRFSLLINITTLRCIPFNLSQPKVDDNCRLHWLGLHGSINCLVSSLYLVRTRFRVFWRVVGSCQHMAKRQYYRQGTTYWAAEEVVEAEYPYEAIVYCVACVPHAQTATIRIVFFNVWFLAYMTLSYQRSFPPADATDSFVFFMHLSIYLNFGIFLDFIVQLSKNISDLATSFVSIRYRLVRLITPLNLPVMYQLYLVLTT